MAWWRRSNSQRDKPRTSQTSNQARGLPDFFVANIHTGWWESVRDKANYSIQGWA